jgi:peptidoglycan/LPS O-acetylase OafA/YrhL
VRREIRSHTGIRGVAALLVVAYHQQFAAGYKLPFETATSTFRRSYLMVDLFFILSGFIISYVYQAERRPSDVRGFLWARFARIYPLHVFALFSLTAFTIATTALLAATGHEPPSLGSIGDWLNQLLLLNAWIPAEAKWNIPSWSISAEAFAYLLFPLLVTAYVFNSRVTKALLFAGSLLFYLLIGTSLDIVVGLAPLRCLAGFSLGMLLFYHRDRHLPLPSMWQVVAVVWILAALAVPVRDSLIIPAFAVLVFATWRDEGLIASLLSCRPIHWLGEISYSVYLMHAPVGAAIWFFWTRLEPRLGLGPVLSRTVLLCVMFAAVLGVSALTHRYIEVPFQNLLRRWRPSRAPVQLNVPDAP